MQRVLQVLCLTGGKITVGCYTFSLVHTVEDRVQLYNQLCATTNIGEVLSSVGEFDCEDFYRKYLHDFVRLAHRCKHSNKEDDIREYDVS